MDFISEGKKRNRNLPKYNILLENEYWMLYLPCSFIGNSQSARRSISSRFYTDCLLAGMLINFFLNYAVISLFSFFLCDPLFRPAESRRRG